MRDLCARYPDEYFRRIGEHRGYLEEFANALTKCRLDGTRIAHVRMDAVPALGNNGEAILTELG